MTAREPAPADLEERVQGCGRWLEVGFQSDRLGWYRARFVNVDEAATVERYLAGEEGVPDEILTWVAKVSGSSEQEWLAQELAETKQLFVLRDPGESIGEFLCQYLARATAGLYQIDGRGFFDAAGRLLVPETPGDGEG